MELIERDRCVFTGRRDLELLHSFKSFPVFMGCVEHSRDLDLTSDMNWWISRSTGAVQLSPLIPLDILYQSSHGSGSVGASWLQHHQRLAECISQLGCSSVLEIGGGHGVLAQCHQKLRPDSSWTIVEPNPTIPESAKLRVIRSVFDKSFQPTQQYDAVVHSHLLEHIYDPAGFLWQLRGLLSAGGYLVFSVPNQEAQFRKNITYVLAFEHTVFLTEDWIQFLLAQNGYIVQEKQYYLADHSVFYVARKVNAEKPAISDPGDRYDFYKKAFSSYIQFHVDMVCRMNKAILQTTLPVYLFGGHVSSQYLLAYGLTPQGISCILDNDPKKHGKRLYGSDLIVRSPHILRGQGPVAVILRQGVFNDEIKKDILTNINPQVEFWE